MKLFIEKLKELFSKNHKKFIAGIVVVAALSLPFVINQVLKQQDIRQRADTAPSITFNFSPTTGNIAVGQTQNVDLIMNAGTNDVGALHFKLKYDPNLLKVTELAQPTALQSIQKTNSQGVFEAVMINPNITPVTGNNLKVFTFQFEALKTGTATVAIDPGTLQATSQLSSTYVVVDNKDNINASFTLSVNQASNNNAGDNSFDYNNGHNHCRPTTEQCETALGESETQASCTTYLGTTARVCTAPNGYTGIGSTQNGCPTISTNGYINYCLPTTATVPSGWTEISSGNAACVNYNGVASKCYKSTYTVVNAPSTTISTSTTISPSTTTTTTVTTTITPSQIPTVTLAPGEIGLKLSLKLPGISKRNGENDHPIRTRRTVKVTVYDTTIQNSQEVVKVQEKTGTVDFNPTTAQYEGTVGIGTALTTGNYIVKVRMDNTLLKRLPGVVHIDQTKQDNHTPTVELVTGDLNQDNALGVQDYTNVMACYNHLSACTGDVLILGDLDDDGVTNGDNDDINIMQFNTINRQGD